MINNKTKNKYFNVICKKTQLKHSTTKTNNTELFFFSSIVNLILNMIKMCHNAYIIHVFNAEKKSSLQMLLEKKTGSIYFKVHTGCQ